MKCPVCQNELKEFDAGTFQIDICQDGCSGMWFDEGELEKCAAHNKPFPDSLLRMKRSPNVLIDRSKARGCPRCPSNQVMNRVEIDPEINFEIDHCDSCGGYWLDIGELQHMREQHEEMAEISSRLKAFEKRVEEQLKDPTKATRVKAFVKNLF